MTSRNLLLPLVTALLATGCEKIPDHCVDYAFACLNVTVDSGPADVHRLRVNVMQGLETSTVLTPKKPPKGALVYPLRFGIRFGRFDNIFNGDITFETIALSDEFDVIGQKTTMININGMEKKAVTISLEDPLPAPVYDLAEPADMSTPPPDMATPDLTQTLDMP